MERLTAAERGGKKGSPKPEAVLNYAHTPIVMLGGSAGQSDLPGGLQGPCRKLRRPLHPPGRDIRCIISVGMLTEGGDCNTVTHIVGVRPSMSQLLCEQVVGRGLRRARYDLNSEGKFDEEVAKVFGVPFEVIPFKADPKESAQQREKRYHVHAVPEKASYEIRFPRMEGYTRAIRNRITFVIALRLTGVLSPGWT